MFSGGRSEGVAKLATWLSGKMDFEEAAEILEQVGQIVVSPSSVWREAQVRGEQFRALEEGLTVAEGGTGEAEGIPVRKGVGMDGAMMNIRGEGWKEFKVGCVFDIEQRLEPDHRIRELVESGHAVHNSYVAHLGGPEPFGRLVWQEAQRRGWEWASDTEVIGDGAAWVWNLAATHFYDSHQVVDWYHASQHLHAAADILWGEGTPEAHAWFQKWETPLHQGHAGKIATMLTTEADQRPQQAEALRREAGYFAHNERRMNYLELREGGWLIGSGMVESGGKQFKARFTGPGMRWSRPGAERLLPIRAAILSGRFNTYWDLAYRPPPN